MKRLRFVPAALLAVAVSALPSVASAGWGSYGSYGSYGSSGGAYAGYGSSGYGSSGYGSSGYGSYTAASISYGSSGYGSSGASSGGGGLLSRLFDRIHDRIHHRHTAFGGSSGSYYSSGGSSGYASSGSSGHYSSYSSYRSYGSYGSSGYSTTYGSSGYGSTGYSASAYAAPSYETYSVPTYSVEPACSTCSGGQTIYSTPIYSEPTPATGEPTPVEVPAAEASYAPVDEVMLTVNVPASAKVFVNDNATRSTGESRQFVSRGLQSGKLYDYVVRVEDTVAGQPVSYTKRVSLRAGEQRELSFQANEAQASLQQVTAVTLHVPADAVVTLAGNVTSATGDVRTFRTTELGVGQTWNDYTIRVSVPDGDQMITKEKTLTLIGGNSYDLRFDFDAPKVAMR